MQSVISVAHCEGKKWIVSCRITKMLRPLQAYRTHRIVVMVTLTNSSEWSTRCKGYPGPITGTNSWEETTIRTSFASNVVSVVFAGKKMEVTKVVRPKDGFPL
jgi:hypothetical protein